MPPKKSGDDGAPSKRKPRAPKERPPGWTNAKWAADVERRNTETRGRADRELKLQAKKAAAAEADEQARQVSMAMSTGSVNGGQFFPGCTWSSQGTIPSPSTFSPASPALLHENYGQTTPRSRFSPSPSDYEGDHGGFNPNIMFPVAPPRGNAPAGLVDNQGVLRFSTPSLRRGPLPFSTPGNGAAGQMGGAGQVFGGMPTDHVMHEMISSGSMAAAASPGFVTQEEARATHSRAAADDEDEEEYGSEAVEEEDEEPAEGDEEDVADPKAKGKGRKKRKKNSPPADARIKWTAKEEECLAEAWKTVCIDGITGANQSYETYWKRVKLAFDERKLVDPYFNKTVMVRGQKAMSTHWGIMQAACSKWHGIQEEIQARPESGADFEQKMRRAFDMYHDDTGLQFKYLNVFHRIEECEKWKEVRLTLGKSKDEPYNPDADGKAATEGRPELGQKKAKEMKRTGPPGERLQASLEKCMADAKTHALLRDEKYDVRWKELLANQGVRIALLKTTAAAKKRNTDLLFLMGGNTETMDAATKAWYEGHRDEILRPTPAPAAASSAPASSTTSPPDTAAEEPPEPTATTAEGTADVPVLV